VPATPGVEQIARAMLINNAKRSRPASWRRDTVHRYVDDVSADYCAGAVGHGAVVVRRLLAHAHTVAVAAGRPRLEGERSVGGGEERFTGARQLQHQSDRACGKAGDRAADRENRGAGRRCDGVFDGRNVPLHTVHHDVGHIRVAKDAGAVGDRAELRRVDGLEVDPHGIGFATERGNI
jgi:hypothetical protein